MIAKFRAFKVFPSAAIPVAAAIATSVLLLSADVEELALVAFSVVEGALELVVDAMVEDDDEDDAEVLVSEVVDGATEVVVEGGGGGVEVEVEEGGGGGGSEVEGSASEVVVVVVDSVPQCQLPWSLPSTFPAPTKYSKRPYVKSRSP